MGVYIVAFVVVLVGIVLYSFFLGVRQHRLNRELETLQHLHDRVELSVSSGAKAA